MPRTLTKRLRGLIPAVLFTAVPALAQAPAVTGATPSAAAPGQVTEVSLSGSNLRGVTGVWTSFPCEAAPQPGEDSDAVKVRMTLPADASVGIGAVRVHTANGVSSLRLFMVDDLATAAANGGNTARASPQGLALPVAVEGACEATSSDFYRFSAKAGERVAVEVVARRLGSSLDPLVRLLDAKGRELVWCDDSPGAAPDCRFEHAFAAGGEYTVEIRDTTYQGGPEFRYRLRVSLTSMEPANFLSPQDSGERPTRVEEHEPNDSAESASRAELPAAIAGKFDEPRDADLYTFDARKGDRLLFRARTRSRGFPCDAVLRLEKHDGTRLAESASAAPADDPVLARAFTEDGPCRLRVRELNQLGGPGMEYRIEVTPDPGFSLTVDVDKVDASASGEFQLKVTCARRDYKGAVTLAVEGVGGEVSLSGNVVKEGQTETRLKAKLPEDFDAGGAAGFRVVGRATIGGREYKTTASTAAALKKLFPLMLYPPAEFDGLIGLGVKRR